MSFISLSKKFPAIVITFALFVLLEASVRILPSRYGEGAGVFLTETRRMLAEADSPEFDYIILGDSRSLSLMGHPPSEDENWSMYNFSLPAMGPRYYRYFLEKILENRKSPPAAVIFAADPQIFYTGSYAPLHDPQRIYTPDTDTTLLEYLRNRVVVRLQILLGMRGGASKESGGVVTEDLIWEAFSHRFLRMFSPLELARQYVGPERVFVLSEAIPLQYATFRHRNALTTVVLDAANAFREAPRLPAYCNTCEGLKLPQCHPGISKIEDNIRIEQGLRERYGQINLADRLKPVERIAYRAIRDKQVKQSVRSLNRAEVDLRAMKEVLDYATDSGIRVVITDVPHIEDYRDTEYFKKYFPAVQKLVSNYKNARMIRFPDPYFPVELYAEQVHYSCEGARRLNNEFYQSVVPRILQFAPPARDGRQRSFDER